MKYNCEFTKEEIETLLHVIARGYMTYSIKKNTPFSDIYDQAVKEHNDKLDELRIKLKDVYKKIDDGKEKI